MVKKISFLSLLILIISTVGNLKNAPATAIFGSPLIFFLLCSAIFFLIPTALISAELSAAFPEEGGIYHWVQRAFGKRCAMTAIWLQWINAVAWYPTMLSFIAGTLAYAIYPQWSENKVYLIACILTIFWGLTWINLKGIHSSARFTTICALIGTLLPMAFLLVLVVGWLLSGQPVQISFQLRDILPSLHAKGAWVSLIAIMASFLGIELASVHVNDIHNPQKNFPRAVLLAAFCLFLLIGCSALAIAVVLPENQINLVAGVMQVFNDFFSLLGLAVLTPIMALAIAIGSIGTMVNWLISPAKGLLHAATSGFFPSCFTRTNRAGVASNILFAQAILVSLFCLALFLLPSVNGFFWFLTALSTELYMMMYIFMFCTGLKLRYTDPSRFTTFKLPGGIWGLWTVSLLGLIGCLTTIIVTFFPPENIDIGSSTRYLLTIGIGNLVTLSPLLFSFALETKKRKQQQSI